MANSTAILIFARSPNEEIRYKKLHENKQTNQQLHIALYNKTLQLVQAAGLPFFIADKKLQAGDSFGERLAYAMGSIFDSHYDAVIAIGSDCPHLSSAILLDAVDKLNQNHLVIGPDLRGGIYLLGVSAHLFNAAAIHSIPWQTKNVLRSLLGYVKFVKIKFYLLAGLSDFNHSKDYVFLKNDLHYSHRFIVLIKFIIGRNTGRFYSILTSIYRFRFLSIKQFRAPPCSLTLNKKNILSCIF